MENVENLLPFLKPFIEALAGQHGLLAQALTTLVVIIGSARAFLKPITTFLDKIVLLTPTDKDNQLLAEVKKHPVVKVIGFLMDYIFSLKLPTKKLEPKKEIEK